MHAEIQEGNCYCIRILCVCLHAHVHKESKKMAECYHVGEALNAANDCLRGTWSGIAAARQHEDKAIKKTEQKVHVCSVVL